MFPARFRGPACGLGTLAALLALARDSSGLNDIGFGPRGEDVRVVPAAGSLEMGSAVAAGDVSGDGVGDILIGSPQAKGPQERRPKAGQVAVVFGGLDLPGQISVTAAARTFFGATDSARLGTAVAVGDLNDDGVGDIIMGAPEADAPGAGDGAVYVFYGGDRLSQATAFDLARDHADVILWGVEQGGRIGNDLTVGDFNGDGRPDLAAAAPREGGLFNRDRAGAVYVFFGRVDLDRGIEVLARTSGVDAEYVMQIRGPRQQAVAGQAVAAGDVNGDGVTDLLIGAPLSVAERETDSGEVYVVFGGAGLVPGAVIDLADPAQVDLRIKGPQPGDLFGLAVGAANVNGDTTTDILIGAPRSEFAPGMETGRAYAVFGRPFTRGTVVDLAAEPADVTLAGPHDKAELGASLCGGDLNGDGFDEWIAAAPGADRTGQAYRILGRTVWAEPGVVGSLTQGARPGDRAGDATAVADVNGDGIGDLVVGAPFFDGISSEQIDGGAVYVVFGRPGAEPASAACVDADGDGFREQGRTCGPRDCSDQDLLTHPAAGEICSDGLDNNCDGRIDVAGTDGDEDGWPAGPSVDVSCVVPDCNDANPSIHPGAVEQCEDGVDNDCNGLVDGADPACAAPAEICGNCVDDDGDGLGDLLEESCPSGPLQILEVSALRARRKSTVARRIVVRGTLDDTPELGDFGGDAVSRGLTVALAIKDKEQLCLPLGKGTPRRGGTTVLRSPGRPATVLRLKVRRDGLLKFHLEHRGGLELPSETPATLAVGFYTSQSPYRGAAELQPKGRHLVQSNSLP